MRQESKTITIEGKKLTLTNLSKVLYPKTGFTKANVIDYYRRIAPYILPHLRNRPVTLKRYPHGVDSSFFYQKNCPLHPDWLKTSKPNESFKENFCLVDDLPSLIWIENLASIEIHTLLATTKNLEQPEMLVFDLDPGEPASLLDCLKVSLIMRDMLEGLGLKSFPKTSGGKGLHFYLPLNTVVTYEQTSNFAKTVAQIMEKHFPNLVVSKMNKELRKGRVFVDWSQNSRHKTTACIYTLRARPQPTVSMPVTWKEIEITLKKTNAESLIYTPEQAIEKLEREGDLFKDVLMLRQSLPTTGVQLKSKPEKVSEKTQQQNLEVYRRKRNFKKTSEPVGRRKAKTDYIFVIQKHAATRLHYDLRLQSQGVLKSWAIPRGLSSNPADRRLAVRTEDHPFDYKDFEGIIPEVEYGAGEVIIWDKGYYINITRDSRGRSISMKDAIQHGKIEVYFEGSKIKGGYAFVRIKSAKDEKENWLVIKLKDKFVDSLPEDLQEIGQSVVTGKSIEDLKKKTRRKSK
ncbi:MAG: hypothetical protein A2Y10_07595 [Planctomycetes bacterium GWF2_41_51]|nr:MAG: hypothetical protein A2Y10_07595 [Planctomycetes bacterium GWF2_41_51]HBG26873.1 hypothetical protein [Phycisphaerales bacterium]